MKRIRLQLDKKLDESYDIHLEKGFFKRIASDLRMQKFAEHYVVISDKTVYRHYGKKLVDALKREGILLGKLTFPAGEHSKSMQQFKELQESLVGLNAHRKTGIIALGGGVTGDLAGFVAASFMRGVPYIQIPTSLLAMVDSSVGGKVGIDLDSGKNLVGAFWQPKKVYIDPEVLVTLSPKHWKAGLGEAIKYGAIQDRSLWEFFEKHLDIWQKKPKDIMPSDWKIIEEMIERCISIKAEVVQKDEKEGNYRQVLNYGHTFAHVIEKMSDYSVPHGEAVATGMRLAASLAELLRLMPSAEKERQDELLEALKIGRSKTQGLIKDFITFMKTDKKAKGDLRVVLVNRLGSCAQQMGNYAINVEDRQVQQILKESGLISDEKPLPPAVEAQKTGYLSPSISTSSYHQASTLSASSNTQTSPQEPQETDLQRRLRLMREKRAQGGGGFLPG